MSFILRKQFFTKLLLWKKIIFWFLIFSMGIVALIAGICISAWIWISQDLPRIKHLADYHPPIVTKILTHDYQLIGELYRERRYIIPLNEIPTHVIDAFIAAEDGDFFKHPGINFFSIIRAAITNFKAGKIVQGGSTITQQVAKALLLTPQRTFTRKIKEMILAWRIECHLTKNEILYLYLNQIYLGHGSYGIEAAAITFFGKHTKQLDIAEAALLAGLVQAPSRYSPLRYSNLTRIRQAYVLTRLVSNKKINSKEAELALNKKLHIELHRYETVPANYYEEIVRQWLEEHFSFSTVYESGLTVITACDASMTHEALDAIHYGLIQLTKRHSLEGIINRITTEKLHQIIAQPLTKSTILKPGLVYTAIVTETNNKTNKIILRVGTDEGYFLAANFTNQYYYHSLINLGLLNLKKGDLIRVCAVEWDINTQSWLFIPIQEPFAQAAIVTLENNTNRVLVLIGGRNFQQSQYNRALQARRSPGSAFKPFIYAAALDRNENPYTPASILIDSPIIYDDPSQPNEKWRPKNYDGYFNGPITFRQALEQSRNMPTIKLLEDLGIKYAINYIKRFGFDSELTPTLSLALGASGVSLLEITRAYTVFANRGLLIKPIFVELVLDRDGKTIYQASQEAKLVITEQTAFIMTNLLNGVLENGTGRGLQIPGQFLAGKTGSTNDLRDAWFIGYSPELTCGVWVGRDDNVSLGYQATGGKIAGPIWKKFMQKALNFYLPTAFTPPNGIIFIRLDKETGSPSLNGNFFEAFKEKTLPLSHIDTTDNLNNYSISSNNSLFNSSSIRQNFLDEEPFYQSRIEQKNHN